MNDNPKYTADQAAAFQKIWIESISKTLQALFTFGPESPPPELVREIRAGIFQALAKSWEEYMRSPQFLDGMKQWMDNAVTFRKMYNDFMANVRDEMQATSRSDIDTIMLTVRHMERRILDRVEQLSAQVAELEQRLGPRPTNGPPGAPGQKGTSPRKPRKPQAPRTK
jgi:hypothetical protein